jgi:hypothetical protein
MTPRKVFDYVARLERKKLAEGEKRIRLPGPRSRWAIGADAHQHREADGPLDFQGRRQDGLQRVALAAHRGRAEAMHDAVDHDDRPIDDDADPLFRRRGLRPRVCCGERPEAFVADPCGGQSLSPRLRLLRAACLALGRVPSSWSEPRAREAERLCEGDPTGCQGEGARECRAIQRALVKHDLLSFWRGRIPSAILKPKVTLCS